MKIRANLTFWAAQLLVLPILGLTSAQGQERQPDQPLQLAEARIIPGKEVTIQPDPRNPANSYELFRTLLDESQQTLDQMDGYCGMLTKQVRIDGELQEEEQMLVKIRHEPFSVYLKWEADGQEALYVEGKHDNCVLARATQGFAALKGVWKLEPDSRKAMQNNRYPVTELGIKKMNERVTAFYDEHRTETMTCGHTINQINGRPMIVFNIAFPSPQESPYSTCEYQFDAETKLLQSVIICEWDYKGEPAGIAEKYVYSDLTLDKCPGEEEFDANNPEYSLAMDEE
ncbi:DUF1571 domain-containing protein [Rubinisphaera margarita]|uniref:DUF1571 domain-containing protein n=1 Tax=Rubinisphaera margarita TaxID=2909586 RepID=UPI001EE8C826|nr:DUF1571 domain-containing protein [Rubinisphaera margarita]MCG6155130.1 DUF1571 domain-containing protein [Rubinisphaera margarita]